MIITLLVLLSCLVWAARVFLTESILNFSLVLLIWIVLFYTFLTCCNFFDGIVNEVGVLVVLLDILMFATLPLVGAALITWFLCVEIPSFDLSLTFNITYFAYTMLLCQPRLVSNIWKRRRGNDGDASSGGSTSGRRNQMITLIPGNIAALVYVFPVVASLAVHVSLHHNVISTAQTRIMNLLLSVLIPAALMLYAARSHKTYFVGSNSDGVINGGTGTGGGNSADDGQTIKKALDSGAVFVTAMLLLCLQNHVMFDELKDFSGLSHNTAGYFLIGAIGFIMAAFDLHRFALQQERNVLDSDAYYCGTTRSFGMGGGSSTAGGLGGLLSSAGAGSGRSGNVGSSLAIMRTTVSACIGAATALIAIVVDIPHRAVPVSVIGAMALAEFYHRPSWGPFSQGLLVIITSLSVVITAVSFTHNTVYHLQYIFSWTLFDMTMQQFCTTFAVLMGAAVALPTLLAPSDGTKNSRDSLLLPDSGSHAPSLQHGAQQQWARRRTFVFEWLFPICTVVFATLELMIREQVFYADILVHPFYFFLFITL